MMSPSITRWCIAATLLAFISVCSRRRLDTHGAITDHAPAMFIFGDSLADVGNNNHILFSSLKANFFPYGVDFPNRTPTGRFSNGWLVLDILASRLGFAVPLPYLSPSTKGLALLQGVNYASAGCGILNETSNNSNGCLSLSAQLRYHMDTIQRIVAEVAFDESQDFLKRSLYFVVSGSNDFLGNFVRSNTKSINSLAQFIDLLVASMSNAIMTLYNQSARRMVLVGVGPLGCTPSQRARVSGGGCNEEVNRWAQSFNEALQALVKQFGAQHPDVMITFANPYSIIEDFIQNPTIYGFNVTMEACCGGGRLNAQIPCLPLFVCCSNRSSHVFWDPWHPSEAANLFLANAFLSTSTVAVNPWSVKEVAYGAKNI